jgi:hypothetical protein
MLDIHDVSGTGLLFFLIMTAVGFIEILPVVKQIVTRVFATRSRDPLEADGKHNMGL